jgi:hypothetical protein
MRIYKPNDQPALPAGVQPWPVLQPACTALNEGFIDALNAGGGAAITPHPPQEIHPYLHFRDQMAKRPKLYIIGTFPPASYLRVNPGFVPTIVNGDAPNAGPGFNFFHGNDEAFWRLLNIPGFNAAAPLQKIDLCLAFLKQHNAVYSDIIYSCSRTQIDDTQDTALNNILVNKPLLDEITERDDQPCLWFTSSGVFNSTGIPVYLNNGGTNIPGNVKMERECQAYNLFLRGMQDQGWNLSVRSSVADPWIALNAANENQLGDFNHKYAHDLQITRANEVLIYRVLTGPSPSDSRGLGRNLLYQGWNALQNPVPPTPTNAFRAFIYAQFLKACGQGLLGPAWIAPPFLPPVH